MKNNPTTMIKCKFSNEINKVMNSLLTDQYQKSYHYTKIWARKRKLQEMKDKEKLELLDKILSIYESCSSELGNYRDKKIYKKKIHKARVERGYKFKQKNPKKDLVVS